MIKWQGINEMHSTLFQSESLTKRCTWFYLMGQLYLIAEVTATTVKKCFELGFTGQVQFSKVVSGEGQLKPTDDCNSLTDSPTGVCIHLL